MGIVADVMGAQKGGTMIMNYAFGLVAFSFIDVALAIVQSISMYYYGNKMSAVVSQLGSNPFTPVGMSEYLQNLQYMQGMMGLASVITVPLVVGIVFKGETMAALGAMNSVMGKYSGDKGGASAKDALASQSSKHQFEAHEQEAYARGELKKYGIDAPRGASAVQTLDNIIAEGEKYGQAGGSLAAGSAMNNGNMSAFAESKVIAGSGHGMQATAMDVGSGVALSETINKDPGALSDFAFQSGTSAVSSFKATAALGHTSQEDGSEISRSNQVKSAVALAGKAKADEVGAGLGLIEKTDMFDENGTLLNNDRTSESIKGAKITSAQKALSQIGLGSTGDIDKISKKAFEDGARSGETMNDASDLMFSEKKDKEGRDIYDRDKAAKGAALKELGSLQADAQTAISADKKTTKEKNGDVDYIMGVGAQARKAANDMIGVGETFGAMSNEDQIALMKKEKKNASTGFFGGIEATNAEIMEHNGGKDAIKDMVTQNQKKGIESAADSHNLRTDYGENLENSKNLVSDRKRKKLEKENKDLQAKKDAINSQSSFTMSDNTEIEAIDKKMKSNSEQLANHQSMTLAEQSQQISQSKIDSQLGQALGIENNKDKGVNYAQNAMYGEESKQQSTKAKIDKQGGVESAVATDVAESSIKAVQQQMGTKGNLTEYLQSKAGGSHSEQEAQKMAKAIMEGGQGAAEFMKQALSGAGALALAQSMGKTKSDIAGTEVYNSPEEYAAAQSQKASSMATVDKTRYRKSLSQEQANKKLNSIVENAPDSELAEKQLIADGAVALDKNGKAIRTKDGKLKATIGDKFTNALSVLGAGDMASTSQLIVGGGRQNVDTDQDGNVLTNMDSSENRKKGRTTETGWTGYLSDMAVGIGAGILTVEGAYRKLGPKGNDGLVKPAFKNAANGLSSMFGAEKPFPETPKESVDSTSSTNNGKPDNSSDSKVKKSVHKETPLSFLDQYGQPIDENHPLKTQAHPSEPKGIVSKFSEMFKSPKMEKLSEIASNAFGKSHTAGGFLTAAGITAAAGYTLFGGTEANASEIPMPKLDSAKALSEAKKEMMLHGQKAPLPKSGTVLDNPSIGSALEDASRDTGYAALGMSLLGFASKTAARVSPIAGDVYAVADTANRTAKGDYVGAAMSTAIGVASNIPLGGTVAALTVAGVQAATDYMGLTGGNYNSTPSISPAAATVLSVPAGGGFVAPTMVQQAADNHSNAQQFAQAIAAQGPQYGPSATEASTSRMADILQDQFNATASFNKKMEINSNAAYTKDTMNHKEMLEHQALVAGLNPDKDTGAK